MVGVDKLALDQEGLDLFGVSLIEHVWILNCHLRGQQFIIATRRAGKVIDSNCKIVEDGHVGI